MRQYLHTTLLTSIHLFVSALSFAGALWLAAEGSGAFGDKYLHVASFFLTFWKLWNAGFVYLWLPCMAALRFTEVFSPVYLNILGFFLWALCCGATAAWLVRAIGRRTQRSQIVNVP